MGLGQLILIFLASLYIDYALFLVMLMAMFCLIKYQLLMLFLLGMSMIDGGQVINEVFNKSLCWCISITFIFNIFKLINLRPIKIYLFSNFVVISAYMLPTIKVNKPELKTT